MKERISKERIHLFAPKDILVTHVEIEGIIFVKKLREAVKSAVRRNELLNTRVVLEKDGSAYYETQRFDENPNETIRVLKNVYWKDIVREQESIAFDIDHGELIRLYFLMNEEKQELLLIGHALAGDAASHAFFIEDIMKGLADIPLKAKPIQLCSLEKLPKESTPSFMDRVKCLSLIRGWNKEGTGFSEEEYYELHAFAWKDQKTFIQYETFHRDALYRIALFAKENQVTVNSVILTAFAKASRELRQIVSLDEKGSGQRTTGLKPDDFALVLSMRGDYQGMGDYEYTMSFPYLYDEELSFADNVERLHSSIQLDNPKEKYAQLQLLRQLPDTLVDSVHFELSGRYVNPITEEIMNRFGMSDSPKGTAVTNLVKVPIAANYGNLKLKNYVYVPPVTPNARRIIGISTFHGVMNISFHAMQDSFTPNSRLFYKKGIECLRSLK